MDNLKEYLKMESILVAGACDTTSASILNFTIQIS